MPNGGFSREQEQEVIRILRHELANAGMGLTDDRREATQLGFIFLNARRLEWDTEPAQKDREYVRRMREASTKKGDGLRQVFIGVCSAVAGAVMLYLLAKAGMK